MKDYTPHPIDTSDIELPQDLLELADLIAQNVHDVWAKARIDQGWTYGEKRDDTLRQTPCLVDFSELTDTEKDYDRNTAFSTLRLIVKLGYKITKA